MKIGVVYGQSANAGSGRESTSLRRNCAYSILCLSADKILKYFKSGRLTAVLYIRVYHLDERTMNIHTSCLSQNPWYLLITAEFISVAVLTMYAETSSCRFPSSPFWWLCSLSFMPSKKLRRFFCWILLLQPFGI